MIIKHNTTAETIGNLKRRADVKRDKQLEKLASGLKINQAADDAAGLAISEKMRAQIRGLNQASSNCGEGIDLLKTAEGALDTVHEELQRMREMAVQSANGTYTDSDREALQAEFSALGVDIDRISQTTEYNTIPLFKHEADPKEQALLAKEIQMVTSVADPVVSNVNANEIHLIYDEVTYDFDTTQSATGSATSSNWDSTSPPIKDSLQKEIIPNVVENILDAYPAFNYLRGSGIGIGLKLESNPGSSVLASVTCSYSGTDNLSFTLTVNMGGVNWPVERAELEKTISHEMMHAFMDEATTNGMLGSDRFPLWFIEGMAQTASGPGNWVAASGGLGLNAGSSLAAIQSSLQSHALSGNTNAANYGTGYLACMYLGYKANGGGVVTAQGISNGLSKILAHVIDGNSLNNAFAAYTGYADVGSFAGAFGSDSGAQQFVKDLLTATGSGAGGVVSGDLTDTDLADDVQNTTVKLFQLNTANDTVYNRYPGSVNVQSGGSTSGMGTEPIVGYDPGAILPVGGVTTAAGDFSVTTNMPAGSFNYTGGVLTITAPGNYSIAMNGAASTADRIVIADGVQLTLDGVSISGPGSAIELQDTAAPPAAQAKITLRGDNTLSSSAGNAIAIGGSAELTIDGGGKLLAHSTGSSGIGGGAKVTVQSGTVIADGSPHDIDTGAVVFAGGSIVAADLNGVAPTLNGTAPVYQHQFNQNTANNALIQDAAVITIGGRSFPVTADAANGLSLWLEGQDQSVQVTNTSGVTKTYRLLWDPATTSFSLAHDYPDDLFTVNGIPGAAEAATNPGCMYDPDSGVLTITEAGTFKISGGSKVNAMGNPVVGKIVVAPNISGTVNLEFDGVDINQSTKSGQAAMEIGNGSQVVVVLQDATTNVLKSGSGRAGLQVGTGAELTIQGRGSLEAMGGSSGAGIGSGNGMNGGKITIASTTGKITATGGMGAAGIGAGKSGKIEDIAIHGGEIIAKSLGHGAGIGGGWGSSTENGAITITGGTITASGVLHGTGIGAGCSGKSGPITINEADGPVLITAKGGDYGSGIGASWHGECEGITIESGEIHSTGGDYGSGIGAGGMEDNSLYDPSIMTGPIKITGGTIMANGGMYGAGIGAGQRGQSGSILIEGGTVFAKGSSDGTGIGGGRWSTATGEIKVTGGDVTAIGGLDPAGNDIGAFTDSEHHNPIPIEIGSTTVQAGTAGEGFNTTGAKDAAGEPVYSYPLDLSAWITSGPPPVTVTKIDSAGTPSGAANIWDGTAPMVIEQNGAQKSYIWMHGEDQEVHITLSDGSAQTVSLKFYPESQLFRPVGAPPPPVPDRPGNPSDPDPELHPQPDPPDHPRPPRPSPVIPAGPRVEEPVFVPEIDGLKLQIGANARQMMIIPLFKLSMWALSLQFTDITTPEHADQAIDRVDKAIRKVSGMRSTYGALQNRLEHVIEGNNAAAENLTVSESRIRDTDMAQAMMEFQMSQIQSQASQAMLAQANQLPQAALELLE